MTNHDPPVEPSETIVAPVRVRSDASEMIIEGHIWRAVWFLAWPTAINTLLFSAYGLVNVLFVGMLRDATRAFAAIGIGSQALMIQFSIAIALSAGTSALVARFLGAEEYENADKAMGQTLNLSVVAGALTAAPLIVLAAPIAHSIGASGPSLTLAADYIALISWFSIPQFFLVTITSALRAAGDVRGPLVVNTAVIAINAFLDWLLILGPGPFPQMGVHGAAIATSISRVAGMGFSFLLLRRSVLKGGLQHWNFDWNWSRRILNIAWPAAIQNLLWSTAAAAFRGVLGALPAKQVNPAQAALTVSISIESVAFMPGIAYSIAATPLVGQNLGAGKPERAEHSAWVATGQAVFIMSAVALLFVLLPEQLAGIFTQEAAVVTLIVSYLRIMAISEPFLACAMVLRGALQGAGDTRTPALITVGTFWVFRLPLAYLLAVTLGHGAVGAWLAMSITTCLSGILMAGWFKLGKWRTIQV
ncbi:MAG: MATE family efflux transporter [Armatimonadetes bacterium]|nr:MATE family efflux transporter [Armatimonadota bacterium]